MKFNELIKEVLGINSSFTIQENEVIFKINIYELAHKCKEWAFSKGYEVNCQRTLGYENWVVEVVSEEEYVEFIKDDVPTEPEAIFAACEWVLENQKEKNGI